MDISKGSCGVPQMHWVLIPSHCITNPRTLDLFQKCIVFSLLLSIILHCMFFRVLFHSFPFSLGNNKAQWRLLLLWVKLINSLISDFHRYRIGDSAGEIDWPLAGPSLSGLSLICFICFIIIWLFDYMFILWLFGFLQRTSPIPGLSYT